jgi:outer membrane protein TolC
MGQEFSKGYINLSLDDCINIALENNKQVAISHYDVEIASAKLNQARSGNWPSLGLSSVATVLDEDPVNINTPFTLEFNDISVGPISIPSLPVNVPAQKFVLRDNKSLQTDIDLMYPVFTGGKISSLIDQAKSNLDMMHSRKRKSELDIIYETKKMYYTVLLTNKLLNIGEEALERLKVTLELTENLYLNGSGSITKIDFLKNSMAVESAKSIVSRLKENYNISKEALKFTVGLSWEESISIAEDELPFTPINRELNDLIKAAYQNNPSIREVDHGLKVFESKIKEAQSEYFPNIALLGKYTNIINSHDYGIVSEAMKNRWMIGLGVNMSLFNGFKTTNKVDEAEAGLKQLNAQKLLLGNGISLNIHKLYYKLKGAEERQSSTAGAMEFAVQNRELTERAYKNNLVDIQEFITAQIMESIMKAQYQITLFEKADLTAEMEKVLGRNLVN